ncbi:MAG: hypothetical protein ACRDSH_09410, partial [Pseudonocardiaceae bacterium]
MASIEHHSAATLPPPYVHLLVADDHVMSRSHWAGVYTAVCGEQVTEPGSSPGDDTRYCPHCTAET